MPDNPTPIERASEMLDIYGQAVRGDWSEIDGREVRDALIEISTVMHGGELTVDEFCNFVNVCRPCRTWTYNCDHEAVNPND